VGSVTHLLLAWSDGDQTALDRLVPLVYAELRRLGYRHMRGEAQGHLLQSTALVHEAYLRLIDQRRIQWQNRAQFFSVSATLMRRVLVDLARARLARKRGGTALHVPVDDTPAVSASAPVDLLALDEALTALATQDARKARVVELRYFAGLSVEESAVVLGVSPDTVTRDWHSRGSGSRKPWAGRSAGGREGAVTPERWERLQALCEAALAQGAGERASLPRQTRSSRRPGRR
jgi:RNA polymerase sigma factor (TIGR02999 family)